MSKCLSTVCDREETPGNRGYCQGHYRRWRLGQPIDTPLKAKVKGGAKCTIVDINGVKCKKNAVSGGLCPTHNGRKQRGTDLYAPVRDYIQTDDLEERLRLYAPTGAPDECWEWTRALNKGYGVMSIGHGRMRGAHIVAWELANGESLPEGMVIRHSCDNPPCTNPAHLKLGTHADNVADRVAGGTPAYNGKGFRHRTPEEVDAIRDLHRNGETMAEIGRIFNCSRVTVSRIVGGNSFPDGNRRVDGAAKLSDDEVRQIRSLYEQGSSQQALADKFGIHQTAVSMITRRKTYTHIV